MKAVTVFAPATVANVAVGFDLLGFPIEGVGDLITVTQTKEPLVCIEEIGVQNQIVEAKTIQELRSLPTDPLKNSCTKGLVKLIEDKRLKFGFSVKIKKGIPLGSGMGGSAASAVGAVVAANRFLKKPLRIEELLSYALVGEEAASGAKHADNVAPCLYGGLVLTRKLEPADIIALPIPREILCVVVHPNLRVDTKAAREILSPQLSLKTHVEQSSYLSGFIAGCFLKDCDMIGRSLCDVLIEPQRSGLVPGFDLVKAAALSAGAMGCSLSGSGPSLFAWVISERKAKKVKAAMLEAFAVSGLSGQAWISAIRKKGAGVVAR